MAGAYKFCCKNTLKYKMFAIMMHLDKVNVLCSHISLTIWLVKLNIKSGRHVTIYIPIYILIYIIITLQFIFQFTLPNML